jgi:hypothetical protein
VILKTPIFDLRYPVVWKVPFSEPENLNMLKLAHLCTHLCIWVQSKRPPMPWARIQQNADVWKKRFLLANCPIIKRNSESIRSCQGLTIIDRALCWCRNTQTYKGRSSWSSSSDTALRRLSQWTDTAKYGSYARPGHWKQLRALAASFYCQQVAFM